MSRFFACAGIGIFFTLAASILAVFCQIGQINGNVVPRNFRMVTVDTTGLGTALGVGNAIYGSGDRASGVANTGIRPFYEWGLWKYAAKQTKGGEPDYTNSATWANEWRPVPAILFDAPADAQSTLANRLPSGVFTSDDYLGRFSKGAFYILFIGSVAGALALICGLLAHRIAFLLCAVLTFFAFLCVAVGCVIWTVLIVRTRRSINGAGLGIFVSYGNSLWLYWGAAAGLLFATVPFIMGCIAGRERY